MPPELPLTPENLPLVDHEVQEILAIAMRIQSEQGDASSEEVLARSATELGISPEVLQRARTEVLRQRQRDRLRTDFIANRVQRFRGEITSYVSVNLVLMALDFWQGRQLTWSLMVIFFWGIAVFLKGVSTFSTSHPSFQEDWLKAQKKAGLLVESLP